MIGVAFLGINQFWRTEITREAEVLVCWEWNQKKDTLDEQIQRLIVKTENLQMLHT